MDLGGILAGAMAGGGKALQFNAQNQLERQREEALAKLERDFKMDAITYEQDRKDQRSAAEALAEARQAKDDREAKMNRLRAEGEQERRLAELEAELDAQYGPGADRPAKVQEIEYLTENVTGGDREAAARIAYSRGDDFTPGDAYRLVVDSLENLGVRERSNLTQEDIRERAYRLYQELLQMDSEFDGGNSDRSPRAGSASRSGGIFSFGGGNTLTRTPEGGVGVLPPPGAVGNVFSDQ